MDEDELIEAWEHLEGLRLVNGVLEEAVTGEGDFETDPVEEYVKLGRMDFLGLLSYRQSISQEELEKCSGEELYTEFEYAELAQGEYSDVLREHDLSRSDADPMDAQEFRTLAEKAIFNYNELVREFGEYTDVDPDAILPYRNEEEHRALHSFVARAEVSQEAAAREQEY